MEAINAFRCASPHKDLRLEPFYDVTQTRLYFAFFPNQAIAICGYCGRPIEFIGKNVQEASECFRQHCHRNLSEHGNAPPKSEITKFLAGKGMITGTKPVGVVLFHEFFEWAPMKAAFSLETEQVGSKLLKSINICTRCFQPKKIKRACCAGGVAITLEAYCECRYRSLPVTTFDHCKELYANRLEGNQSSLAEVPLPSLVPPNTLQISASPASITIPGLANPAYDAKWIIDPKPIAPGQYRLKNYPDWRICVGSDNDISQGIAIPIKPVAGIHYAERLLCRDPVASMQREPPPRSSGTVTLRTKYRQIFGVNEIPSLDEQRRSALLSAPIRKSNGKAYILLKACEIYLQMGSAAAAQLTPIERRRLNDAVFTAMAENVTAKSADNPLVAFSSGINCEINRTNVGRYASALARFVWISCERKIRCHEVVVTEALEAAAQDERNQNTEPSVWILDGLTGAIQIFLYAFCVDKKVYVNEILKHFAFVIVGEQNRGDPQSNGDAEGDGEDEIDESDDDGGGIDPEQTNVREANIFSVRTIISRLITCCKFAFVLDLMNHREVVRKHTRSLVAAAATSNVDACIEIINNPLTAELEPLKGTCVNLVSMAMQVSLLGLLEKPSPSTFNASYFTKGTDNLFIITRGSDKRDGVAFFACAKFLLERLKSLFIKCVGNGAVASQLWEGVMDPMRDAFQILPGEGDRSFCPQLNDTTETISLNDLVDERLNTSSQAFRASVEEFHDAVLTAIQFCAGTVMRAKELTLLMLSYQPDSGNLFLASDNNGITTLGYTDLVSKTLHDGFAILPFWVARLVLIDLHIFRVRICHVLWEELANVFQDSVAEDADFEQQEMDDEFWNELCCGVNSIAGPITKSCLGMRARFSRGFLRMVRIRDRKALESNVEYFECIDSNEVRSIISANLNEAMNVSWSFAIWRHVLLQFKTNIAFFLDERLEQGNYSAREKIVLKGLSEISKTLERTHRSLVSTLGVGMHSMETNVLNYQTQTTIKQCVSISKYKVMATQYAEASLSAMFRFPIPIRVDGTNAGNDPEVVVLNSPRGSLWRDFQLNSERLIGRDPKVVLKNLIREKFGFQNWSCYEQSDAASEILTGVGDVALYLPCGSGKTIAFLTPLAVAPSGFSLVVVPYVALRDSQYDHARLHLGLSCELYEPRARRFSANAYSSGDRPLDDSTRFVYSTTDAAVTRESLDFLLAATAHKRLNAIVVDESHQVLMAQSYRCTMKRIRYLGCLGVKIILASGTIPESIEPSLLNQFGRSKESMTTFRKADSYGDRLLVNLVKFEQGSGLTGDGDMASYVHSIVKEHLRQAPGDRRPIIIFCLSKAECELMFDTFFHGALPDGTMLEKLHADVTQEERKSFLRAFSANEPHSLVIGCSTTAGAEGIDYCGVGLVLVAGAAFGGLLMVHQMFNRAGRGISRNTSLPLPQAWLIYDVDYVDKKSGSTLHGEKEQALLPFRKGDQGAAAKLVTIQGLETLFEDTLPSCGGKRIEQLLGVEILSAPCGACNLCLSEAWPFYQLQQQVRSGNEYLSSKKKKRVKTSNESGKDPSLREINEADRRIVLDAKRFLESLRATRCCPWCGQNQQGGGKFCYPNTCPALKHLGSRNKCFFCFNDGHSVKDVKKILNNISSLPADQKKPENAKLFNHAIISSCATVIVDGPQYQLFRPCPSCWLSHEQGDESMRCDNFSKHIPRAVTLIVWHTPDLRRNFLQTIRHGDKESIGDSWKTFFRWLVYEGTANVQNLYQLLAFFSKSYESGSWKKTVSM